MDGENMEVTEKGKPLRRGHPFLIKKIVPLPK